MKSLFLLLLCTGSATLTLGQSKIIDMHIHAYEDRELKDRPVDYYGVKGSPDAGAHFRETYQAFRKLHVVKAVVSGTPKSVADWVSADSDHIIIKGILVFDPEKDHLDSTTFERMVRDRQVEVFGELGPYYGGTTLSDPIWRPFLRICERYDIPVAVHTGGGDPGGTYSSAPKARLRLGDPYLVEDVLVEFPKLRLYVMHAGEDWYEHALRLMAYYPQLYVDLGVILWVEPLDQRYATEFLKAAKKAGYLDRVMFGTDQMKWPYAIEKSVRFLNSLDFLTKQDKEGIFYGNAARFLRLRE